jgi:hypothetical protein
VVEAALEQRDPQEHRRPVSCWWGAGERERDRAAVDLKGPRQDEPFGGVLGHWRLDLGVVRGPVEDRVQPELAGEEVAGLISQRPGLAGAVEVQLEGVDAVQAELGGPDRGEPVGPAGLVELVQTDASSGASAHARRRPRPPGQARAGRSVIVSLWSGSRAPVGAAAAPRLVGTGSTGVDVSAAVATDR